jgi:hypothetical protein
MTSTELIAPPLAASAEPTVGESLDETLPLIGAVPVYGPPVVVVAGPWLLMSLMLAGPFALLVTVAVMLMAAAALVWLIGWILAAPYLLLRHLRGFRAAHAPVRVPAARPVPGGWR